MKYIVKPENFIFIEPIISIIEKYPDMIFGNISYTEADIPIEYSLNYFLSEKIKFEISVNIYKKPNITHNIY